MNKFMGRICLDLKGHFGEKIEGLMVAKCKENSGKIENQKDGIKMKRK